MNKPKKEVIIKMIKEHINFLVEFDRFEMARFFCEIASKISYDKLVGKDYIVYLSDSRVEINEQIITYLKTNNLIEQKERTNGKN